MIRSVFSARSVPASPVLLAALLAVLLAFSQNARAAYRCDSNGSVTYTDAPCPGGKALPETDLRQPATVKSDQRAAQLRADADKAQLATIESLRNKAARAELKERTRARAIASNHRKRCDALALQTKWANEDAAHASGRKVEKTTRKSHRLAQKYALDCQV